MREVVERITCDIGGEVHVVPVGDKSNRMEAVGFEWMGARYAIDVCQPCKQDKLMRYDIASLIETAVLVRKPKQSKKAVAKKAAGKKKAFIEHAGPAPRVGPDINPHVDGSVTCPRCGVHCKSEQGFKKHWTQQGAA